MKVDVEIDTDNLHKKTVDKQGRVYLGRDYIGDDVEIAIVDRSED